MRRTLTFLLVAFALLTSVRMAGAQTQDDLSAEIQQIKQRLAEMDTLKARLADLEKKLAASQQGQPAVATGFPGSKVKLDGRIFAGIFSSGDAGSFPNWSTDINDAKLRLTFNPSKNITVVNRLNATGARTGDFDYFYLDYAGLLPATVLRLGQRKIDVGQETWTDNPVENILITNSISHVSGYGIGLAARGAFSKAPDAFQYEAGFVNGPRGVSPRPTSSLPVNLKIGRPLPYSLYASASYFDSGRIRPTDSPAISVAELTAAPAGAAAWKRTLWEMDLRYNYGPTGIRNAIPSTGIPALMLGATYGHFNDSATGATRRDGNYWFVEGLHGITGKLYAAARYSTVDLGAGVLAKLGRSSVDVNSYRRTSLGLGYRLTELTDVKTEYTVNDTSGGTTSPSLNQWAVGVASKF